MLLVEVAEPQAILRVAQANGGPEGNWARPDQGEIACPTGWATRRSFEFNILWLFDFCDLRPTAPFTFRISLPAFRGRRPHLEQKKRVTWFAGGG